MLRCTYPISEDLSSGLLMCSGNYIGVALTYTLDPIVKLNALYSVVTPAAIVVVVGTCMRTLMCIHVCAYVYDVHIYVS